MKNKKPYKDADPLHTINRIRKILETVNIFTIESHQFSEGGLFCSARVRLGNNGLSSLDIGTNGKGVSPELALASAYGEFLERLQNKALITNTHYLVERTDTNFPIDSFGFDYVPDEEYHTIYELFDNIPFVLLELFNTNNKEELIKLLNSKFYNSKIITVPFYHLNTNQTRNLPMSLISHFCSTNGMCAGNTYEEALIQGICEIIERYVIKQIYLKNISPPNIPIEYFSGTTIYEKIKQLEKDFSYRIIIKDCSLGEGWPVIGVLLINEENLTYRFKLGADTNPSVALERCITEIYQGISSNPTYCNFSITHNPFKNTKEKIKNYYKTIKDGTGYYPQSIFNHKVNYHFNGYYVTNALTSSEDFLQLTNFIVKKGFQIFIRDNSFLDFPTFQVYIPKMSELNYFWSNTKEKIESLQIHNGIEHILKIKRLKNNEIRDLINTIERLEESELISEFIPNNYFLYNLSEELEGLLPDIFKVMIYYKNGDVKKSYDSMLEIYKFNPR